MQSLNRVSLIGHLGADPETHTFQSGDIRTAFSLATTDSWKDDAGAKQERTQWHRVSILNQGLAKVANDYLRKGSAVMVEGAMEYRNYTDGDGTKRQAAEVVLRPFNGQLILLDGKRAPSPE